MPGSLKGHTGCLVRYYNTSPLIEKNNKERIPIKMKGLCFKRCDLSNKYLKILTLIICKHDILLTFLDTA